MPAVSGPIARLDRFKIAERHLVEAFDLRSKAFEIFLLSARRDGRQRAPVKRAFERDQAVALRRARYARETCAPS